MRPKRRKGRVAGVGEAEEKEGREEKGEERKEKENIFLNIKKIIHDIIKIYHVYKINHPLLSFYLKNIKSLKKYYKKI